MDCTSISYVIYVLIFYVQASRTLTMYVLYVVSVLNFYIEAAQMYVRTFYVVTVKQYKCTYVHSTWIQYHSYVLIFYGEAVQTYVRCLYVDEVHN